MRRVAAVVLPRLLVELAAQKRATDAPNAALAVILDAEPAIPARVKAPRARDEAEERMFDRSEIVAAVNPAARAFGARAGQKLSEAHAMVAHLEVVSVSEVEVRRTLHALAEVGLSFSPTVEVRPIDAVWIDVTGVAHLFGGEEELVRAIEERMRAMGHEARVGLGDGPRIAEALARFGHAARRIALPGRGAEALAPLPLAALPLPAEARAFFARLAVVTVGDLAKLPRSQVTARLSGSEKPRGAGERSPEKKSASTKSAGKKRAPAKMGSARRGGAEGQEALLLVNGFDPRPLRPFLLPDILEEKVSFEEGLSFVTQLLFVASGMTSRLEGRLFGRGQAANRIDITLELDRAIHALRTGGEGTLEPGASRIVASVVFPAPLSRAEDLFRTVKAKLEHLDIVAPVRAFGISLHRLVTAPRFQLDLSRDVAVSPDALPSLLSELVADLGPSRVGILLAQDEILPERRSRLVPIDGPLSPPIDASPIEASRQAAEPEPVRLFALPVSLGPVSHLFEEATTEGRVVVGVETFSIERVLFDRRIDLARWWTSASASRDYFRVMIQKRFDRTRSLDPQDDPYLQSAFVGGEAWIYVDRESKEAFLQGFWE